MTRNPTKMLAALGLALVVLPFALATPAAASPDAAVVLVKPKCIDADGHASGWLNANNEWRAAEGSWNANCNDGKGECDDGVVGESGWGHFEVHEFRDHDGACKVFCRLADQLSQNEGYVEPKTIQGEPGVEFDCYGFFRGILGVAFGNTASVAIRA